MDYTAEQMHPNWRALASVYFQPKRFVCEKSEAVPSIELEEKYELQGLSGEEIKEFYEEIVENSNNVENITKLSSPPTKKCVTRHKQILQAFDKQRYFRLAASNDVESLSKVDFRDNINTTDAFGWTALMMASCEAAEAVIKLLLNMGADKFIKDKSGKNALDVAQMKGHFNIVQLLRNHVYAKDVQSTSKSNNTAMNSSKHNAPIEPFYCSICKQRFSETSQAAHQTSTVHRFNEKSFAVNDLPKFNIPNKNRGLQLMVKQGWNKDSGLGPSQNGRLYPVKTVIRKNRTGLGIEQPPARVTHYDAFDVRAAKRNGPEPWKRKRTKNEIKREKVREWKKERRLRNELS